MVVADTALKNLQILATGLNAHSQLSAHSTQDLNSFTPVTTPSSPDTVRLLYAGWSTTVLQLGSQVLGLGLQDFTSDVSAAGGDLFDAVGDEDGLLECLDPEGRLWTCGDEGFKCVADPDGSPLIGHLALAGNGKVAITFKQAPSGRLCHVLCFDSLDELRAWYANPAEVSYNAEKQHFMMQGQPRQLLAGTGTFLLRMESGEVYSWGDSRYSSLGRSITDTPAEHPGAVEALGGLKIKKVACGGWLNAALSEDGACYLWGANTPGTEHTIKCLQHAGAGEIVLVELLNKAEGEPLDVLDVAIGDNHVVLLADGNQCFAAGESKNGQLALGRFESFVNDWTAIDRKGSRIDSIICGPKSTYVFAESSG